MYREAEFHQQPVLLHDFLLNYVKSSPNKIAIVSYNSSWTYKNLYEQVNKYYEKLNELDCNIGDKIILELEPCPQAIALIIACSRLGLVFIPVSPEVPRERLIQIVKLTEPKIVIQHESSRELNLNKNIQEIKLIGNNLSIKYPLNSDLSKDSMRGKILDTDLAYIIFTSGSTGTPKGIMMTHKAVLSFYRGLFNSCGQKHNARIGSISPLQFDFSLIDIGMALGSGATIVQIPRMLVHNPKRFISFLAQHKITQMNSVPSLWELLFRDPGIEFSSLSNLTTVFYAGEGLSIKNLREIKNRLPSINEIINCFGHSESIACSFMLIKKEDFNETYQIPIGYAHSEVELMLLDENKGIINEPNIVGEIYLRGASLFSGYWQDNQKTKSVLLSHPSRPDNKEVVFKSGDLAYYGKKGELYYKGRKDTQIKILGYRVEVEEIEKTLEKHPKVDKAIVVSYYHEDLPQLVAFIKKAGDINDLKELDLRQHCTQLLPIYMIPSVYRFITTIPYTVNQKVDRNKLRDIQQNGNIHNN
ncbi:AMP-binding protein [Bacillus thuringiensis]|uniref:AMP-binding protein n=1 Tax=Bacillus thuringiensis TaxID=1428 RepID=UPI0020D27D75|nr:AMP-binding protein [Bacillus thuringiensis]